MDKYRSPPPSPQQFMTDPLALSNIGRVRKYLDQTNTERLVHVFKTSRLDYCNSLLYGVPEKDLNKLQRLQNSTARLVTGTKPRDHITTVLRTLHWLPVRQRITFKILLIVYKIVNQIAPACLCDKNMSQNVPCVQRLKNYWLFQRPKL